jgi:transmembrane sensor
MDNYGPYFNIAELIAKRLRDELTEEEETELERWLQDDPHNRELFDKLLDGDFIHQQVENYETAGREKSWEIIARQTGFEKKIKRPKRLHLLPYAAAVLLLLAVGIKFTGLFKKNKVTQQIAAKHPTDFKPGGNKAVLTLADGSKIILDGTKHGKIARQQSISIENIKSGEIVYNAEEAIKKQDKPVEVNLTAYNTIETPRGGQYEVVLPDGTKVWLNAASSLKYPVLFAGNDRRVDLTGEAYFEVAKNAAKPFIVKTRGQSVEVLGTHFNINSYTDEDAVKTTLLEGSVKVHGNAGGQMVKLVPGQQAVNVTGNLSVLRDADTDEATAWKNGKFVFRDVELKTIMRQLSRWYDVDVVYQGQVVAKHYRGRISRNVPVSQLLEILNTSGLNFTINGREIIVKS